jgi:hypothetical protein
MITELQNTFESDEFIYNKIFSNRFGMMFELVNKKNNRVHFEVFQRKVKNNKVIYPEQKDFFFWAWTFKKDNEAFKKFNELKYL